MSFPLWLVGASRSRRTGPAALTKGFPGRASTSTAQYRAKARIAVARGLVRCRAHHGPVGKRGDHSRQEGSGDRDGRLSMAGRWQGAVEQQSGRCDGGVWYPRPRGARSRASPAPRFGQTCVFRPERCRPHGLDHRWWHADEVAESDFQRAFTGRRTHDHGYAGRPRTVVGLFTEKHVRAGRCRWSTR